MAVTVLGNIPSMFLDKNLTVSPVQIPVIQVIERPEDIARDRILASGFESKPSTITAWSGASNDSLFSIQIGALSFSRDEFRKQDKNRVIFSLKVGLAVLLVSLLILFQAPYQIFGTNIIWSILTVAIMFKYTVGTTFNRGFNRALGSVLAGILAIIVAQVALSSGTVAEPYTIGVSILFIGTITSFMKLWPSLAPYEYGFRVILFTYCLIIISGYRMGSPIVTAIDRLYSIAI